MKYERLKENLNVMCMHNHTQGSRGRVVELTGGRKTERQVIDEIVFDCREILNKIEQGTLIEFPRVVQRKIPIYDERSIDFDKSTTVWDLEEMKPQGVVVTRFLFESSAMDRLKELQE